MLNKLIVLTLPLVPKFIIKVFAKKYIAGSYLSDAVSLTKELEKRGIGRPSTYASIPNTLFSRGYIEKQKNTIFTTEMGVRVSNFLIDADFCFVDLEFTKNMETDLDCIAKGDCNKLDILTCFWNRLKEDIVRAKQKKDDDKETT